MTLFDKAVEFAVEKHSGQTRKAETIPYILHPLEVATIVGTMTSDEAVLCAAVLHDTVEDTNATPEEIREIFGKRISLLVLTETEDKREDKPPAETWRLRKEETLAILENTKDEGVKMMWLGDKLSNMRSFHRLYLKQGLSLWNAFHQKDPKEQKWYYEKILEYLSSLKEYAAYQEFERLVNVIFEDVE